MFIKSLFRLFVRLGFVLVLVCGTYHMLPLHAQSSSVILYGEGKTGDTIGDHAIEGSQEASPKTDGERIVSIVSILLGLLGVINLAVALYKYNTGDYQSERAFLRIGFALILFLILLNVLSKFFV